MYICSVSREGVEKHTSEIAQIIFDAFGRTEKNLNTLEEARETVRWFLDCGGEFYLAKEEEAGAILGFGVGLVFTDPLLEKVYPTFSALGAQAGDYYCAFAAVSPHTQRRGVYRQLLEHRLVLAGDKRVWIRTWNGNRVVIEYVLRLGFRVAGSSDDGRTLFVKG